MGYTVERFSEYTIECDKCEVSEMVRSGDFSSGIWVSNTQSFLKLYRKEGWSIGKQTLCPKCRGEER